MDTPKRTLHPRSCTGTGFSGTALSMSRHIRVLLCAVALAGASLLSARASRAGVIVWQQETPGDEHAVEMIQGHRAWLARGPESLDTARLTFAVVDDLDQ